ncbi:MAG: hypothetical protein IJT91_01970 [Clostridia bacterium]|nr:hypothetical protein [Clostridia bacterium]
MIRWEIKKLLNLKVISAAALFIILNFITAYYSVSPIYCDRTAEEKYRTLYLSSKELFEEEYQKEIAEVEGVSELSPELTALISYKQAVDNAEARADGIKTALLRAEENLKDVSEQSYTSRYLSQVINSYSVGEEDEPEKAVVIRGWDALFSYKWQAIYSLIACAFISAFSVLYEKRSVMDEIIIASRNGKKRSRFAKLFACIVISLCVNAVIMFSSMAAVSIRQGFYGGWSALWQIPYFRMTHLKVSAAGYLFVRSAMQAVGIAFFASVCIVVSAAFGSHPVSLALPAAVYGIIIPGSIARDTVHNNISSLFDPCTALFPDTLFKRYSTYNIFGFSFESAFTLTFFWAFATVILGLFYIFCLPVRVTNRRSARRPFGFSIKCRSVFLYEFKKILFRPAALLIVGILILAKVAVSSISVSQLPDDSVYREYVSAVSGPLTRENVEKIRSLRIETDETLSRKEEVVAEVKAGNATDAEYREFMRKYWDAYYTDTALEKIEDQLDRVSGANKGGWLVYSTGYDVFFAGRFDILLLAACAVCCIDAFSIERTSRMYAVLSTCKHGGRRLRRAKLGYIIICCAALCLIFTATDIIAVTSRFPFQNILGPANSVLAFSSAGSGLSLLGAAVMFSLFKTAIYIVFGVSLAAAADLLSKRRQSRKRN